MSDPDFLHHIDHTSEELASAKIGVAELRRIYDEHQTRLAELDDFGQVIQRSLARFPGVHSTRLRIKSPRSLMRKVIRKRIDDSQRNICFDNYKGEVRDLVGLRALHLFKEDWQAIDKAITDKWELHPDETPLAYLREGDGETIERTLKEGGFEVRKKGGGYRSLHFVIQTHFDKNPCYAEIQVRTLFEEAWGEVDHQVRYPEHQDDELLSEYLLILNRLAGGADEMASLLLRFKAVIETLRRANENLEQERAENLAVLKELEEENARYVDQLNLGKKEKDELKRRLEQASQSAYTNDLGPNISTGLENRIAALLSRDSELTTRRIDDDVLSLAARVGRGTSTATPISAVVAALVTRGHGQGEEDS